MMDFVTPYGTVRIVGFEYPTIDDASDAFERAHATIGDCSVWRSATPDGSRHFVSGIFDYDDEPPAELASFDWGNGVVFIPSRDQIEWMLRRRDEREAQAHASGEEEVYEINRDLNIVLPGGGASL